MYIEHFAYDIFCLETVCLSCVYHSKKKREAKMIIVDEEAPMGGKCHTFY